MNNHPHGCGTEQSVTLKTAPSVVTTSKFLYPAPMALRRRSLLASILLAPLLLGSTCSPSDPGCEYDESCGAGETRECINYCLPVWSPETGGRCAVDSCDIPALEGTPLYACPEGYFCQPSTIIFLEGLGSCMPTVASFGETCDPLLLADSSCSEGTACFPQGCERADEFIKATGVNADLGGICLTPTREGGICDSNLSSGGISPSTGEQGCSPCESGTYCLPNSVSGRDGPPNERRCTRACDSEGSLDHSLCACGTSRCIDVGAPVVDEVNAEVIGPHFCTPCDANLGECDMADPNCCDPSSTCSAVTTDLGVSEDMCCRGPGSLCDTAPGACCPGNQCDGETCRRCAREGEDPSIGCCEGFTEFQTANGTECLRCAAGGFTCSDERLDVLSTTGDITSVTIAETDVPWYRHQEGAGGDISMPGTVNAVRYELTDQHRAYLFPHALSSPPPGPNWSALLLPHDATSVPIPGVVDVPASTVGLLGTPDNSRPASWDGVRVYDVGSCSQVIRWPLLVNVLALQVNRALDNLDWGLFGADPFTPARRRGSIDFSLRPLPAAAPRMPHALPHGPLVDDDRIAIRARYTSPSAGGCAPANLVVEATIAIRSRPAALESRKSVAEDALLRGVGCTISSDGEFYDCLFPELSGSRPPRSLLYDATLARELIARLPGSTRLDEYMTNSNPDAPGVRCDVVSGGTEYRCAIAYHDDDGVLRSTRRLHRAVFDAVEAVDWFFELTDFRAFVEGVCILDPYVDNAIRSSLEPILEDVNEQISAIIGQAFGTSLSTHFEAADGSTDQITPDDLIPCGDPISGGDDLACQERLQIGGRRHRCSAGVTNLVNSSGQFICDVAHVEVRRMFVRPEGLELVFAEGPDDSQHDLLQFEEGFVAPGSGISRFFSLLRGMNRSASLLPALDLADPPVCSPTRWTTTSAPARPEARGVFDWFASTTLIPGGVAICASTDSDCTGICGQFGTTCERARQYGLDDLFDVEPRLPDLVDLTCREGTCVPAP